MGIDIGIGEFTTAQLNIELFKRLNEQSVVLQNNEATMVISLQGEHVVVSIGPSKWYLSPEDTLKLNVMTTAARDKY